MTLHGFLDAVAARSPAPGGGAVTAAAGALACALGRMVAAYSVRKDMEAEHRQRIERIADQLRSADELLRSLIDRDAESFERLFSASKIRGRSEDARRDWQEALLDAAAVPMQMAAWCERALALLEDLVPHAGRGIVSDLGVAATLANAAAEAARFSVDVNLSELEDRARARALSDEIERIVSHAVARSRSMVVGVRKQLDRLPPVGR